MCGLWRAAEEDAQALIPRSAETKTPAGRPGFRFLTYCPFGEGSPKRA